MVRYHSNEKTRVRATAIVTLKDEDENENTTPGSDHSDHVFVTVQGQVKNLIKSYSYQICDNQSKLRCALVLSTFFWLIDHRLNRNLKNRFFSIFRNFDHVWSIRRWSKNWFFFYKSFLLITQKYTFIFAKIYVYFRKNRRLFSQKLTFIFVAKNSKLKNRLIDHIFFTGDYRSDWFFWVRSISIGKFFKIDSTNVRWKSAFILIFSAHLFLASSSFITHLRPPAFSMATFVSEHVIYFFASASSSSFSITMAVA